MIRYADIAKPERPETAAKPDKLAAARKAMAAQKPARKSNSESNAPTSKTGFDRKAYQRDLMRKRRAKARGELERNQV